MLSHLVNHVTEVKLTLAAALGLTAWIADASGELNVKGWEEIGLKGILLFAVYYIGRLFLQAQRDHKKELEETWRLHKAESSVREERMCITLEKQCASLDRIAELNEEQCGHFRAFVKTAVDEKMKSHP